jgi:signal peptide peptidase SppA
MTDTSRTASEMLMQAADAGVAPLLLGGSHWAIRQDVLPRIASAMRLQTDALTVSRRAESPTPQTAPSGVVVIPLTGIITPQGSFLSMLFGGAPGGLLAFREQFRAAMASPDVSAIVIDVDSPGGITDLVTETATEIRAARGQGKRIVAIADTQMASAAYWIASQADEIVATPSGSAGSVGVYRIHQDWSVANAQMGIAFSYIAAGKYKVEGNPDQPLDEAARAAWQADVQDAYDMFVADVAAGRGVSAETVIADYGEGRSMNAQRALDAGLVDRVATFDEVVSGLLASAAAPAGPAAISFKALTPEARAELRAEILEALAAGTTGPTLPPGAKVEDEDGDAPELADLSDEERAEVAALLLA